ncbi:hypothetical protein [Pseudobutyrivibrio xylanivorans]|uniref:Uncharacterized protein n=1 Tax=Pseudobutyrivibrio xylanivorans DSM 14809 TaxID=1123012 RepID=A0A1M6H803_PSEXY|nr:hypothetical protein [Pseudobutyrivibrio xylanivorans]SHJ18352.1 hypothetical protein SAMN02745725_01941 [Pseudobutyrivibrio xylanivorans DSM 14809]
MRMRKFLASMMAVAMVASVAPAYNVQAAGLTQASNAEDVNYGTISAKDMEMLKSLFDLEYYMEANPDIVKLVGADADKLFEHFCKCGIFEGRTCNPNFDPAAYASAYGDLKEQFGLDILKYYEHYATVGSKENRTLTTVKACAESGITVNTLSKESVAITPSIYKISVTMGTVDFTTVAKAVVRAQEQQRMAVVETAKGTYVFSSSKDLSTLKGYTAVDTIKVGDTTLTYYVFKNDSGTAVYRDRHIAEDSVAVFKTSDSVVVDDSDYRGKVSVGIETYSNDLVDNIVKVKNGEATRDEANIPADLDIKSNYDENGRYHSVATNKQESGNIINVNSRMVTSGGSSMNGGGEGYNCTYFYLDGAENEQGIMTPFEVQPGEEGYYEYVKENVNRNGGQNGWLDVDTKGDNNTEYTVCIGAEREDGVTDLTVGVYSETTGTYYWSASHLEDKYDDDAHEYVEHFGQN